MTRLPAKVLIVHRLGDQYLITVQVSEKHRCAFGGLSFGGKKPNLASYRNGWLDQSSQYRVLVQIELEKYLGSFRTLRFGESKPFHGTCHDGQLGLFYYRDPGLKTGKPFPLSTIQ